MVKRQFTQQNNLVRVFTLCILVWSSGCSLFSDQRVPLGPEAPETQVEKQRLPDEKPTIHTLKFSPAQGTEHRRPVPVGESTGTGDSSDSSLTRKAIVPFTLSDERVLALRTIAEADEGVKRLLGDRYAFIDTEPVAAKKKVSFGCCHVSQTRTRLGYYSHTNSMALDVFMRENHVIRTAQREGYLPPEGQDDAKKAIDLARQDSRLAGKVENLDGHVILMEPNEGVLWNDPGYGHRMLWVTFSHGNDGNPQYFAVVDLSDQAVLEAGEDPKPQ